MGFWEDQKVLFAQSQKIEIVLYAGSKLPPCGWHSDPVSSSSSDNTITCAPGLKSRLKPAQAQGMPVFQKIARSNKAFPSGESIDLESDIPESQGHSCYLLAVWCWVLHFLFLDLSFPNLKMKVVLGTSGLCEDAFIQQVFIEHLLYARHCSNFLGHARKENKGPWPWALPFLGGEGWEGRRDRWSIVT